MESAPLLDWIDTHGSVLVLYPQSIDPANVVAAFLTNPKISGKTVLMMVQDPKSVNASTGIELPEQLYIPYDDSKYLQSVIKGNSYIVIDSPTLYRLADMNRFLRSKKPESKIVFVGTFGILDQDIEYIRELFPDLTTVRMKFANERPELQHNLQVTLMNDEQTQRWEARRHRELETITEIPEQELGDAKIVPSKSEVYKAVNMIESLQIGNFVYPKEIQDHLDRPRDQRPDVPPDTDVGQGGFMTKDMVHSIGSYSMKIMNLLTILAAKYNEKHVIYTKYREHYGVNLLDTLLYYIDIPHTVVTGSDDSGERYSKYQSFAESPVSEQRVLITNILPSFDISNTANLHFLEGINVLTYQGFIDHMYRYRLFRKSVIQNFTVYFHVTQRSDGTDGSDAILYRKIVEYLETRRATYVGLYEKSNPIGFVQNQGLVVIKS
jgi:hypothetical protein